MAGMRNQRGVLRRTQRGSRASNRTRPGHGKLIIIVMSGTSTRTAGHEAPLATVSAAGIIVITPGPLWVGVHIGSLRPRDESGVMFVLLAWVSLLGFDVLRDSLSPRSHPREEKGKGRRLPWEDVTREVIFHRCSWGQLGCFVAR